MNPQTNNRPQSAQHKPEAQARQQTQHAGNRASNKNNLNADTTTQYQEGKEKMAPDQREAILQENHNKTHDKLEPKVDHENHTNELDENAHYTKNDHEKKREHGSHMNKEEV